MGDRLTHRDATPQLPLSAIRSVRAMPEDEAPYASVELGAEHYYLEIATVRACMSCSLPPHAVADARTANGRSRARS